MLGFGLSKTFWTLFTFRCAQGAFNGNIGVSKTAMNEISDPKNAADMYSMMPLVWSIARSWAAYWQTLRPNGQIRSERFNFYDPVLIFCHTLPSAVARAKSKRRASPRETDPLLSTVEPADFPETEPTAPAPLRQLITRPVLIAVLNYAFLNFCSMSYDALLPLVYATPIGLGGLGLTPYSIGLMMGLCGISNAFVQGLFRGRIIRYVGPRRIYTGCFCAVGLAYAA
ncbi:major facilitator superfamily domain-containing protein [Mycena olivaceomarginata]|nr:major facilitator superfamily domain-containing protein [Mycena olivaceomarginata]